MAPLLSIVNGLLVLMSMRSDTLCYVMSRYVMSYYVMSCYVMLCYVMLCYVMLCYVMLCCVAVESGWSSTTAATGQGLGFNAHTGPWEYCAQPTGDGPTYCNQLDKAGLNAVYQCDDTSSNNPQATFCERVKVVQAFTIISSLLSGAAFIYSCYSSTQKNVKGGWITLILLFANAIACLIAWAVWVGEYYNDGTTGVKLDYGVGLMVAAWILTLVSTVVQWVTNSNLEEAMIAEQGKQVQSGFSVAP